MAYREYKCAYCGRSAYVFEGEEHKIRCSNWMESCYNAMKHSDVFWLAWEKMPPNPVVIHQTECFMSEPVLDSMDTNIELDRLLTREKQHERELKLTEEARKNT